MFKPSARVLNNVARRFNAPRQKPALPPPLTAQTTHPTANPVQNATPTQTTNPPHTTNSPQKSNPFHTTKPPQTTNPPQKLNPFQTTNPPQTTNSSHTTNPSQTTIPSNPPQASTFSQTTHPTSTTNTQNISQKTDTVITNNNEEQKEILNSQDTHPDPTPYPTLTPEITFTPRMPFTLENIMHELYFYRDTLNIAGVRAAHEFLRAKRVAIETPVYNRTLAVYVQCNEHVALTKLLAEMTQDGIPANPSTHIILLNHASNRANQAEFNNVLAQLRTMVVPREDMATIFNIRLKFSLRRKNSKELIAQILEEMRAGGYAPDEYTYNTILRYHADNTDLPQCLRVLDEMRAAKLSIKEPIFETIFDACVNEEQVQEVQGIMKNMGMHTTLRTYNTRINEAAKKGDFARCRDIMNTMTRAGVNPDVVTYNSIFAALAKKQKVQECNDLLKEMIKKGVQPDTLTYNTIAVGWAAQGYFTQALELVGVMRVKQLPTMHALTSVIYHTIMSGNVDKGLSLFEQMVAEGTAAVGTYNSVMYSLLHVRAIPACERTYAQMRERGVQPDHITYQALVILAQYTGQDVLALREQMRADNVEPNEGMYNTLLRKSKGPAPREMELIKEMRSKGLRPEDSAFLKVMKGAAYTGDTQTCTQLLADMRTHGDAFTSQLYHLLAIAYMNQNNEEAVWKTVAEMRELKLGPTDETYKVLLDFLQNGKNWERCVEILEEMETNHILPVGPWL